MKICVWVKKKNCSKHFLARATFEGEKQIQTYEIYMRLKPLYTESVCSLERAFHPILFLYYYKRIPPPPPPRSLYNNITFCNIILR